MGTAQTWHTEIHAGKTSITHKKFLKTLLKKNNFGGTWYLYSCFYDKKNLRVVNNQNTNLLWKKDWALKGKKTKTSIKHHCTLASWHTPVPSSDVPKMGGQSAVPAKATEHPHVKQAE